MQINEAIRKQRGIAGITQAKLAAECGVAKATISMWECGRRRPPVTIIPKLAEILQCSIQDFFEK